MRPKRSLEKCNRTTFEIENIQLIMIGRISMRQFINRFIPCFYLIIAIIPSLSCSDQNVTVQRTIKVDMVVLEQTIKNNRLGAEITNGQMYALARDVVPLSLAFDKYGNDIFDSVFLFSNIKVSAQKFRFKQKKLRYFNKKLKINI